MKIEDIKDQATLDKLIGDEINSSVEGLLNKNSELLGKLSKAKEQIPENIDELLAANDKLKKIEDGKLEEQGEFKKLLDTAKTQHAEERASLNDSLKTEREIIKKLLVNDGLSKALSKNSINPVLLEAAISILSHNVSVVDIDGKRVAQVGDKSLDDFVKDWSATDVGKNFILAPSNNGGGSGGNNSNNSSSEFEKHFQSKTWNLTEQAKLLKSDPEKYAILHEKYPSRNT